MREFFPRHLKEMVVGFVSTRPSTTNPALTVTESHGVGANMVTADLAVSQQASRGVRKRWQAMSTAAAAEQQRKRQAAKCVVSSNIAASSGTIKAHPGQLGGLEQHLEQFLKALSASSKQDGATRDAMRTRAADLVRELQQEFQLV